ncbi:MAG TPA: hypothetical protein VGR84_12755 [Candidatus Acidoferrales bacterium]|nr:hypothetical protein [Candidatus Acidoferrales bacterium]
MKRSRENIEARLREQSDFLRRSAVAFYEGNFAESVRIAGTIRTLVYESGRCKPLLKQARSNGLDLQISEHVSEARQSGEELFNFAAGIRIDPGIAVYPSVDLESSHYTRCSIGAWWNRRVFSFRSDGKQMIYTRSKVILTLANMEGGAHVDDRVDPAYAKLLTDQPLTFESAGVLIETPDLARFLAAQSGVEMLECLKRNFFPDLDVPSKWDCGTVPPSSISVEQISGSIVTVPPSSFPNPEIRIKKR